MTEANPYFSIIVPSYNQGRFLDTCLRSLLAQRDDGTDLEILVLDGGSEDETLGILKRYDEHLSYWRSSRDQGQVCALREGFDMARGEIFGWVNSDDALMGSALRTVADWFRDNQDHVAVYGDAVWIDAVGDILRPKREIPFIHSLFAYGFCYLPQPSTFFKRAAYQNVGGLDASLECGFDYDLWHRLAATGRIGHIAQILSLVRDHPDTKTNQMKTRFQHEDELVRQRYLRGGELSYGLKHLAARATRLAIKTATLRYKAVTATEKEAIRDVAKGPNPR